MDKLIVALYRNEKAGNSAVQQGTTLYSLLTCRDCRFTRPDENDSRQAGNQAVLCGALLLQDLQIMFREPVIPELRLIRS